MMRNMQSSDECSEPCKQVPQKIDARRGTGSDQMMLDYLLDCGFLWEEAITLLNLREHLYENAEMYQRITDDHRMQFAKWLYEHNMMSDD